MDTVLKQLYEGTLFPAEEYKPLLNEYKEIMDKQFKHYDDFVNKLNAIEPALSKEFKNIIDEYLDVIPHEFYQMFIDGFRLGSKITFEIFNDEYIK